MAIDSDFDYGEGFVQNAGFLHTFPSDIEFCGLWTTVPVNHYSDPEGQQNRTEIL